MKAHKDYTEADAEAWGEKVRSTDWGGFSPGFTRIQSMPKERALELRHEAWQDKAEIKSGLASIGGMRQKYPGAE